MTKKTIRRKISSFNFVTLNGFFKGPNEDTSWHQHGGEEARYSEESLEKENILLFGRVTYEMMAAFWPTPVAAELFPKVAKGMNKADKIVFSKKIKKVNWTNTTLIGKNLIEEIKSIKRTPGKDITILGSGSIVTQLTEAGLIDEYQIMIDPLAIGKGTPLFSGIQNTVRFKLKSSKAFRSGTLLLIYEPAF